MTTYYGMFRSNEVQITDPEAVNDLIIETTDDPNAVEEGVPNDDAEKCFHVDGQHNIKGDKFSLWSTDTTFDVWDREVTNRRTEEFLKALSQYLAEGEELLIRSVGYEGARFIPDAYQYRVTPDGSIKRDTLPTVSDEKDDRPGTVEVN